MDVNYVLSSVSPVWSGTAFLLLICFLWRIWTRVVPGQGLKAHLELFSLEKRQVGEGMIEAYKIKLGMEKVEKHFSPSHITLELGDIQQS